MRLEQVKNRVSNMPRKLIKNKIHQLLLSQHRVDLNLSPPCNKLHPIPIVTIRSQKTAISYMLLSSKFNFKARMVQLHLMELNNNNK